MDITLTLVLEKAACSENLRTNAEFDRDTLSSQRNVARHADLTQPAETLLRNVGNLQCLALKCAKR